MDKGENQEEKIKMNSIRNVIKTWISTISLYIEFLNEYILKKSLDS